MFGCRTDTKNIVVDDCSIINVEPLKSAGNELPMPEPIQIPKEEQIDSKPLYTAVETMAIAQVFAGNVMMMKLTTNITLVGLFVTGLPMADSVMASLV